MRGREPFDVAASTATAEALAGRIPDEAVPAALAVNQAHADAQNQTLGNVRTRAATVLSSAAVVVTFATSVGLLRNSASGDGVTLHPGIAVALLLIVVAIGALTVFTQLPRTWSFNSGSDVFGTESSLLQIQRAAFILLEVAIARNDRQLGKVLSAYRWSTALLGLEAALVVIGLIVS
ncbi:hypothetical protein [Agrococcus sp. Ld7]|uniref:hypothetical protein n=1 Tax=Agrococcus sp. Ld7 TaxID=649148 RepID=UPI003864939A